MRFSHFIASKIVPHDVVVYVGPAGTRGTQLAPPGTISVVDAPARAGRPARVRQILIFAAAFAASPRRRYASAARRSTSALRNSGYAPTLELLRMYFKR